MIFLDYIYYFFACLYKLSKRGQYFDQWRISASMVTGGVFYLFSMSVMAGIDILLHTNYLMFYTAFVMFFPSLIFFGFRYEKYTSYEEVAIRLKSISSTKQTILNLLLVSYFLFTIGMIVYVTYTGFYLSFDKK